MSYLKAIREKCLDCCCNSSLEVKLCSISECPLHPYRLGKNPNKRELTEEQRNEMRERFIKNMNKDN